MQILKEEVRKSIINSGIKQFYEYGYEKASIRRIVKEAKTTIGNFYNYFSSKEDLFYNIITPVYEDFIHFVKQHNEEENSKVELELIDLVQTRSLLEDLFRSYDKIFDIRFVILIDGSKGTKYEKVKEEIIVLLSEHFNEHVNKQYKNMNSKYFNDFSHIIGTSFIEGLLYILRKDSSDEIKKRLIVDYIIYYSYGAVMFLKD